MRGQRRAPPLSHLSPALPGDTRIASLDSSTARVRAERAAAKSGTSSERRSAPHALKSTASTLVLSDPAAAIGAFFRRGSKSPQPAKKTDDDPGFTNPMSTKQLLARPSSRRSLIGRSKSFQFQQALATIEDSEIDNDEESADEKGVDSNHLPVDMWVRIEGGDDCEHPYWHNTETGESRWDQPPDDDGTRRSEMHERGKITFVHLDSSSRLVYVEKDDAAGEGSKHHDGGVAPHPLPSPSALLERIPNGTNLLGRRKVKGKKLGVGRLKLMRQAAKRVKWITKLQASYRGERCRQQVLRSGILNNLELSSTAVRKSLRDVAVKHQGLFRMILHVVMSAVFVLMVASQFGGTEFDDLDPFYTQTSLIRRIKSVSPGFMEVESTRDIWGVLKGVVDEFYAVPLQGDNLWDENATAAHDYLGCALPPNTSVLLSKVEGVSAAGTRGVHSVAGRGYIDGSNRLLHSLLVVQQRRNEGECTTRSPAMDATGVGTRPYEMEKGMQCPIPRTHAKEDFYVKGSTTPFHHVIATEAYDEEALEWSGYPLAFDIGIVGMGAEVAKCKMDWFDKAGWLDLRLTKEVKAIVATYNPNGGSLYSIAVIQWDFNLAGSRGVLRAYSLNSRTLSPFNSLTFNGVIKTLLLWGSFALYIAMLTLTTFVFIKNIFERNGGKSAWAYKLSAVGKMRTQRHKERADLLDVVLEVVRMQKKTREEGESESEESGAAVVVPITPIMRGASMKSHSASIGLTACEKCLACCQVKRNNKRSRRQTTSLLWEILDFFLIATLHIIWVWWLVLAVKSGDLETAFSSLREHMVEPAASVYAALDRGASQDEVLAVDEEQARKLVVGDMSLIDILLNFMMYKRAIIVASVLLVLRFFRLLQFHKRTALIGELLSIASSELLHFIAVYLPVHFSLVWTAVLLYGSESTSFHTFLDALHFLSIVFIGDPVIPEDVLERHSVSPYIFFWM